MSGVSPTKSGTSTTAAAPPPRTDAAAPSGSTDAGQRIQADLQNAYRQDDYQNNPSKRDTGQPIRGQHPTPQELRGLGLPENGVLGTTGTGQRIGVGSDPGNYYCERAFYTSTEKANERGTSIVTNERGEALTGFIHISGRDRSQGPGNDWRPDPITTGLRTDYNMAERQRGIAEVVGRGIRGFAEDAQRARPDEPVHRILVTGYGQFNVDDPDPSRRIANNPTGEFVSHKSNIDMAMQSAYGDRLVGPGRPVEGQPGTYRYDVRDPNDPTRTQGIEVRGQALPVNASAVNGSEQSIQRAVDTFRPHAVISLGVNGGNDHHEVEHHADNGGFTGQGTTTTEAPGTAATHAFPENYALARAISRVSAAQAQGQTAVAQR
jgi:pyrrolidone-carboxylate peptidase